MRMTNLCAQARTLSENLMRNSRKTSSDLNRFQDSGQRENSGLERGLKRMESVERAESVQNQRKSVKKYEKLR